MSPARLGAIGWLLVVPALYITAFDWFSPRNLREAWRGPEALSGELDQTLACDLVTDWVKENQFAGKVSCEGELVSLGDVARLQNVVVDKQHLTYCLARAPKWVVLRAAQNVPCFPTPPPDLTRPAESERERVEATTQAQVNDWREGIRAAMASSERPSRCPEIKGARLGVTVPVLEDELLQSTGDPDWAFLTTPWLHDALVMGDPASVQKAHQRWSKDRPWVAVITSASREAPRTTGFGKTWVRGQLTGTLSLIDAEAGEVLCQRELSFRSSDQLEAPRPTGYKKGRINIGPLFEVVTEDRVMADFKRRYESAVLRTVNEMTGYGVRTTFY